MSKEFRTIRLQEWIPKLQRTYGPSDDYMLGVINQLLLKSDYPVNLDEWGFLNSNNHVDYAPSDTSIILGDSIPECLYMPNDHRIECVLHKLNPDNLYLNGAKSGTHILDLINLILNKIIPHNPKKIFIMLGVFDGMCYLDNFYGDKASVSTLSNSPTFNYQMDFFTLRKNFMHILLNIISKFQLDVTFGTYGHRNNKLDPYLGKFTKDVDRFLATENINLKINDMTRTMVSDHGGKLIDFEAMMFPHFDLFYDMYHLSSKGANFIAKKLNESGF